MVGKTAQCQRDYNVNDILGVVQYETCKNRQAALERKSQPVRGWVRVLKNWYNGFKIREFLYEIVIKKKY